MLARPTTSGTPMHWTVCCRPWEVAIGHPTGRCGLCGRRPKPIPDDIWHRL